LQKQIQTDSVETNVGQGLQTKIHTHSIEGDLGQEAGKPKSKQRAISTKPPSPQTPKQSPLPRPPGSWVEEQKERKAKVL
jgi:hypothetical protein